VSHQERIHKADRHAQYLFAHCRQSQPQHVAAHGYLIRP
jgi:hypothetical protein